MTAKNPFNSLVRKLFFKRYKCNKYWNHYYNKYETRYLDNRLYISNLRNIKNYKGFVKTVSDINLTPNLYLESACISDIKSTFGKPLCLFSKKIENENLNVLLYKLKLLDYKVIAELHFFRDHLYYFTYNFVDTKQNERTELIEKVLKKYEINLNDFNIENSYLIDSNQNCLVFNDDVDFSISYFKMAENNAYSFFKKIQESEKNSIEKKLMHKEKMFYKLV